MRAAHVPGKVGVSHSWANTRDCGMVLYEVIHQRVFWTVRRGGGKDNPRCAVGHLHLGLRTLGKLAGRLLEGGKFHAASLRQKAQMRIAA